MPGNTGSKTKRVMVMDNRSFEKVEAHASLLCKTKKSCRSECLDLNCKMKLRFLSRFEAKSFPWRRTKSLLESDIYSRERLKWWWCLTMKWLFTLSYEDKPVTTANNKVLSLPCLMLAWRAATRPTTSLSRHFQAPKRRVIQNASFSARPAGLASKVLFRKDGTPRSKVKGLAIGAWITLLLGGQKFKIWG